MVYEGHWNKVSLIYTFSDKDILITISESNVKVWDLEYDECIKNMNDHSSSIVYAGKNEGGEKSNEILTIGTAFEVWTWNYETTNDSLPLKLQINEKNQTVLCAYACDDLLFLATTENKILIYDLKTQTVNGMFFTFNDE